jgi:5-methylthioadenosine/S-adenosylhomocysteine deaminase
MSTRILITGGTVITCDPDLGTLPVGDVLVDAGRIVEVAPRIDATDAQRLDATDRIVLPGFVDTHRHTWQSVLRNIGADWTLSHYLSGIHAGCSRYFRPEDTRTANLLGALEALDAGITTMLDWSHNLRTPDHADAAIDGLAESGIRAVFAYGGGADQWAVLPSPVRLSEDLRRIRGDRFPGDEGLLTLALAARGPQFAAGDVVDHEFGLARDLDLPVTVHVGDGEWGRTGPVRTLHAKGFTNERVTYVHCNTLADDELRIIADTGGSASVAPVVEMQMGHGWPATGRLRDHGINTSFSIDVCSSNSGDMFNTMRTAVNVQRALDNAATLASGGSPDRVSLTCQEALEIATIGGARALGRADRIGSLTPGKEADVVVLRTDTLASTPRNHPVGNLVYAAHQGLVEAVLVAGVFRKRDGRLLGPAIEDIRRGAVASRDHIIAGYDEAAIGGSWIPTPFAPAS